MNQGFVGWGQVQPPIIAAYISIQEQQASATAAGAFTQGSWQTRLLNTIVSDDAGLSRLVSNQIVLAAGTYECMISCPAWSVVQHQARLQNVSDGVTLLLGTTQRSNSPSALDRSLVSGRFRLFDQKTLAVQHQCQTTKTVDGFGPASGWGVEVYAIAEFWRIL